MVLKHQDLLQLKLKRQSMQGYKKNWQMLYRNLNKIMLNNSVKLNLLSLKQSKWVSIMQKKTMSEKNIKKI